VEVSDLDAAELAGALGDRPVRSYPALLATEPVAMAWAREGAPAGALVVADYQASPRGRAGMPWSVTPGWGLGFTLLARPELPAEREGWPYAAALLALDDVVGGQGAQLAWPDTLQTAEGGVLARLGVYVELGPAGAQWVSVTVLVVDASPPRGPLLARLVSALEQRMAAPPEAVLPRYLARCSTIGRQWRARLIPLGPGGPEVNGEAVNVLADGALVLLSARGARVAVPPQNLGFLEPPPGPVEPPEHLLGRRRP
jgi:BirA family biotin operon repressor/biotin-[acetyl-CoA-carboxylase] ligase